MGRAFASATQAARKSSGDAVDWNAAWKPFHDETWKGIKSKKKLVVSSFFFDKFISFSFDAEQLHNEKRCATKRARRRTFRRFGRPHPGWTSVFVTPTRISRCRNVPWFIPSSFALSSLLPFLLFTAPGLVSFFFLTRVLRAFHNSNDKVNLKMWPCPPIVYICVWDERELLCIGQNRWNEWSWRYTKSYSN